MSHPFKNLQVFTYSGKFPRLDEIEPTPDPSGGQWATAGLVPPIDGDPGYVIDINPGKLVMVQFNERMLPGKVRDEALKKRLAEIEEREGRKPNKKEYASLRDKVQFEMLPKAFIRRTRVAIVLIKGHVLVFTSSTKKADEAVAVLDASLETETNLIPYMPRMSKFMVNVLTEGSMGDDGRRFDAGRAVVLVGNDKEVIRVKGKDVTQADIQALASKFDEYRPTELRTEFFNDIESPDSLMYVTVTDKAIFKALDVHSVKATKAKEDFIGFAAIYIQAIREMLSALDALTAEEEDDDL